MNIPMMIALIMLIIADVILCVCVLIIEDRIETCELKLEWRDMVCRDRNRRICKHSKSDNYDYE